MSFNPIHCHSYAFRSAFVASRQLMMRIELLRSVYTTTSRRPRLETPMSTQRSLSSECSTSCLVIENESTIEAILSQQRWTRPLLDAAGGLKRGVGVFAADLVVGVLGVYVIEEEAGMVGRQEVEVGENGFGRAD